MSKNLLTILSIALVLGLTGGCNKGSFSGSSGGVRKSGDQKDPNNIDKNGVPDSGDSEDDDKDDDDKDKEGNDEDLGQEDDSDKDDNEEDETGEEAISLPQKCTATNGKVVSGVTECPANNAAFTSDDGGLARMGCCPLPSRDILDKASKAVGRGGSCQTNEIAVGSDGSGFMCRKINTKKYRLETAERVCYRGNGAAGGAGSDKCKDIIAQLAGLISLENDRDGCVAQPYGAIMTHKTGKDCKDQKASVIVLKETGLPVKMFP